MNRDKEIKHIKRNIMISYLAIHVILLGHQCVLFLFMSHQAELNSTGGRSKSSLHRAYILIKTYMEITKKRQLISNSPKYPGPNTSQVKSVYYIRGHMA